MISNIKAAIDQHFVISKLKKEAKVLHREQPQFTLMECQNKIAQNYGYLHWHELHTCIKNRILKFQNVPYISTHEENNFHIGKEAISNENIYLSRFFNQINIANNEYTFGFLNLLSREIIEQKNAGLIYIKQNEQTDLTTFLTQYSKSNNIPIYNLSFAPNNDNDICFDFSKLSPGVITEILLGLFKNDEHGGMWTSRAISMITRVLPALIYLKSIGKFDLTPKNILNALDLDYIINMYNTEDFPHYIKSELKTYIHNLPHYDIHKEIQHESVYTMHEYLKMQFIAKLNYLDSIYAYVLKKQNNNINFLELLEKQKTFILIVDFPKREIKEGEDSNYNVDLYCLTTLFMNSFSYYHGNSTIEKAYKHEVQNQFRYYAYLILDNIEPVNGFNKDNPLRLAVNTIMIDNKEHTDGIDIVPMKDKNIIIKENKK